MVSSFKLCITPEESLEVRAEKFEVTESGVLVFYEEPDLPEGATLGDIQEEYPFAAYKEWHSVIKDTPQPFDE